MESQCHQPESEKGTCLWCSQTLTSMQRSYCSATCKKKFLEWLETEHASIPGVRPQFWNVIRKAALERDEYRCQNCNATSNLSVHHIIPLSSGGNSCSDNLTVLCYSCHQHIHGRTERKNIRKRFKIRIRYQPLYTPAFLACDWFQSVENKTDRRIQVAQNSSG